MNLLNTEGWAKVSKSYDENSSHSKQGFPRVVVLSVVWLAFTRFRNHQQIDTVKLVLRLLEKNVLFHSIGLTKTSITPIKEIKFLHSDRLCNFNVNRQLLPESNWDIQRRRVVGEKKNGLKMEGGSLSGWIKETTDPREYHEGQKQPLGLTAPLQSFLVSFS